MRAVAGGAVVAADGRRCPLAGAAAVPRPAAAGHAARAVVARGPVAAAVGGAGAGVGDAGGEPGSQLQLLLLLLLPLMVAVQPGPLVWVPLLQ